MNPIGGSPLTFSQHARRFILAGCCIAGVFFVLVGILGMQERYATESWVAREATITESQATWSISVSRPGKRWYPKISATYLDDNEEVRVAVAFGRWLGWGTGVRRSAEEDVARYPVGRVVTIYHAPDNPRRAVLERLPWQEQLRWLALGLVLLGIPVLTWRSRRTRARA